MLTLQRWHAHQEMLQPTCGSEFQASDSDGNRFIGLQISPDEYSSALTAGARIAVCWDTGWYRGVVQQIIVQLALGYHGSRRDQLEKHIRIKCGAESMTCQSSSDSRGARTLNAKVTAFASCAGVEHVLLTEYAFPRISRRATSQKLVPPKPDSFCAVNK